MKQAHIKKVPLFASLPEGELQQLASSLHQTKYPPKTIIFHEGEVGNYFSIILKGKLDIVKALDSPDERLLATHGPGDFVGEMSLLYKDGQRSASARTRTPVTMLNMSPEDFNKLLTQHPSLSIELLREMSTRLRNTDNASIRDLKEKNRLLSEAYQELKEAQAQLIEKEKLEHELRMAHNIQKSILPKQLPSLPGWKVAVHWQPARVVSGDFYDFIHFPDGCLGVMVGDVTGKGIPAALVMATTRSVLRSTAIQQVWPGRVLAQANQLLCEDMPAGMFVTCLYAVLNPKDGSLRIANAGHIPPYQKKDTNILELRARGMPLGLLPDMDYEEMESHINQGECMSIFSDGIIEAHNPQREMYGMPRLLECMAQSSCASDMIQAMLEDLASFIGSNSEQEDDVTVVTLERTPIS